ncbi:hypothetical protein ACQPW1_10450 [Nocardia sp. CA-128927]|uniref:hypothetical protein n=1 Tax=Nocardia sp. CA-128927 TaxID=3239975 RepID=UPI003D98F2D1
MTDIHELPLSYIVHDDGTGDGDPWATELGWLWTHDSARMLTVVQSIAENGQYTPIDIAQCADQRGGKRNRMWNGHRRVAAHLALGLPLIAARLHIEQEPE